MRKISLIPVVTLMFLVACQPADEQLRRRIDEMEKMEVGTEHYEEWAGLCMEHASKYPDQVALNSQYLSTAANLYSRLGNYEESNNALSLRLAMQLPDSLDENRTELLKLKARNYRLMENHDSAIWCYQSLDNARQLSGAELLQLASEYEIRAESGADSTARIKDLVKAANIVYRTGNMDLAVTKFESIADSYPNSDLAPYSLMRSADIRGSEMEDKEGAESVLKRIIASYPESNFARDAQIYLDKDLIGKSEEEQLEIILNSKG